MQWVGISQIFISKSHILALLPSPILIQNLSNSLDHIYHLVSPFSPPTLLFDGFALHNDLVCGCWRFWGWGHWKFFCGGCCVPCVWVYRMFCWGCWAFWPCKSPSQSSSIFLQMGQFGPHPHFSFIYFSATVAWGINVSWDCASTFIVGVEVSVGGIGQSFLNSNKFSDIHPALGHGVPAQVGIFSSGGGLLSAEEPPWGWISWNFPLAKFIIVIGMVSDVCMVMLSALRVGTGLATTHTLYHLVGINFLLLSLVSVPLLIKGLVLGWVGLGWLCWDWICCLGFGPNFPSNSMYVHLFYESWVWMEPEAPGVTFNYLAHFVPSKCVDASHRCYLYLNIHCFHW